MERADLGPLFQCRTKGATRAARFDGPDITKADTERLSGQLNRVLELMSDGHWRTLRSISDSCVASEASVSARLRDLRKPRFGSYSVERRRVADGLWEYRVLVGVTP